MGLDGAREGGSAPGRKQSLADSSGMGRSVKDKSDRDMDWGEDGTTLVEEHLDGRLREVSVVMQESCRPMALIDDQGLILDLNELLAAFLTLPKQNARGRVLFDVLSARGLAAPIQEILMAGQPAFGERAPFSSMLDTESASRMHQVVRGSLVRLDENRCLLSLERSIDELSLLRRRAEAVSHIAHNMRSSLTSVRGFTELLLNRDFSKNEMMEFLGHIHHEGLVMQHMVDALATYVYYQSGRALNWPITSWPVRRLVDAAIQEVQGKQGDAALDVDLADPDQEIVGNLEHLSFGLSQVIENAILFGGAQGKPRITGAPEGHWYRIDVRDDGPGMTTRDRRRAFEPFYSGSSASKDSRPRMGLGLTVARYTVEVHGGQIHLESASGQGTVVSVSLPRLSDDA